ncbi:MAG: alpha/beta fold hydrolase [Candidatus Zixiibacteriota bacterium]
MSSRYIALSGSRPDFSGVISRECRIALASALVCAFLLPCKSPASAVDECLALKDSLELCYTYQKAGSKKARALIVTLPMRGRDRTSFGKIVEAISARRPEVSFLNFDLRGHGQSIISGADSLSHLSMSRKEYARIPDDIREALSKLRRKKRELKRLPVVVIGASIGANSAAILANIESRVKAAVMLSPGTDYLGLIPGPHVKMTDGKRMLYMVGREDIYSYVSTDSLYRITRGVTALNVYNTRFHGTNIPNNSEAALADLLKWLDETLELIEK